MAHPLLLDSYLHHSRDGRDLPFPRRVLHPWMNGRPTVIPDAGATYATLLPQATGERFAYLHIPFCTNRCLFCGFYRNKAEQQAISTYVDHLIREIEQDATRPGVADHPISAVFIGGGTPSALSAEDLTRLLTSLRQTLPLAPDCEITVEGRVAGFTAEKIDACLDAGANRFSIGIQSFDTTLRRRMGRKASGEDAVSFLRDLVARDRASIVCDLIYGLPGQTDSIWQRDVELCADIGLNGVDLYCLTLQPDSPLALSIKKGALPAAADHPEALHRYEIGEETLARAGWTRLSQAHWGRTKDERNRYNQGTKQGFDCLAFGAGAGGMLNGHRFMQEGDAGTYQSRVTAGEKPIMAMLAPTPQHKIRGVIMDGVERGILDLNHLDALGEAGFSTAIRPLLCHWQELGLANISGQCLELTRSGRYWNNNMAADLFTLIETYIDGPRPAQGMHTMPGMPPHAGQTKPNHPHAGAHHVPQHP